MSACNDDEPNTVHYNPWHEPYNEIWYEASEKLPETTSTSSAGLHTNAFNTTIQSHTFENGQGKIVFADDVTSIGNYAFRGCSGMTSVTISSSVTSIGESAFSSCKGLTSVTIPNSVTSIGEYAFYNCSGLTSVTIPNSVTNIELYTFYGCKGLTNITIPNSVTSIGKAAFYDCSGMTSVTISSSVTSIGESAFQYCSRLTTMTIEATTPPTLGAHAISDATTAIYVPSASVNAYKTATNWSSFASKIQPIP